MLVGSAANKRRKKDSYGVICGRGALPVSNSAVNIRSGPISSISTVRARSCPLSNCSGQRDINMVGRVAPRAPNGFCVPVGRGVPAEPLTGSPHRLLAQPEASPYPMAFEKERRARSDAPYLQLRLYRSNRRHLSSHSVELDGFRHGLPASRRYDQRRQQFLAEHAIEELRFWNHQWRRNREGVLLEIWLTLHRRTGCVAVMRKLQNHRFVPPDPKRLGRGASSPRPSPPSDGGEGEG